MLIMFLLIVFFCNRTIVKSKPCPLGNTSSWVYGYGTLPLGVPSRVEEKTVKYRAENIRFYQSATGFKLNFVFSFAVRTSFLLQK